ncbi:MAG: hypothetical protein OXR72_06520 [Gemmatimonadota bacterium]|nr:hypothetical protein [Gemmatimonadota bacterium]
MGGIASLEEACFAKWQERRPLAVPDGAVHPATYEASDPKLLFILKEVNDIHDPNWDLREFLRKDCGRRQTWNNVARWVTALSLGGANRRWDQIRDVENVRRCRLRGIAAMNVKKTTGSGSSDWNELAKFASEDACHLKEQFGIYEPDIAVLCGVPLDWIPQFKGIDPQHTRRGIEFREYKKAKFGIRFWHPQARYPAQFLYYSLADAATEIREQSRISATNGN